MDVIPTELLSMILSMYISNAGHGEAIRLRELQERLVTASIVSKSWNKVLFDAQCMPASVHAIMDLEEVEKLCEYTLDVDLSERSSMGHLFSRVRGVIIRRLQEDTGAKTALFDDVIRLPKVMKGLGTLSVFAKHISYLDVELPDSCRKISSFDCSMLDSFPMLEELRLQKFKTVDNLKHHFPKGIKRLVLEYGEIWERDVLQSHSISIVDLPCQAQLDFCSIRKAGTLGIVSRQIINQIRILHVDALYVLMSVAVEDRELLTLFQKPYREGAYVPPHILADWEVIEMSHRATDRACTILLEHVSASNMLQSLTVSGEACQSLKIIPSLSMNESEDLSWISSITEQASSLLYGMSGEELKHRLDILQMMRISDEVSSPHFMIHKLHIDVCGDDEDDGKRFQFIIDMD